jgi:hypothetical protein
MYAFVSAGAFVSLLIVADCFLNKFAFVPVLAIVFEQIVLHFLDFVRQGVQNLDEYELRSRPTISNDLGGVSHAVPASSTSPASDGYLKLGEVGIMSRT